MHNLHRLIHRLIASNRPFFIFLAIYIVLRVLTLNINYTEWGDTFRMIRGADFLSHGSWPWDEKRWPLYSVLLIPGIWFNVPVLWGRILSIFISSGTAILIYAFYLKYISQTNVSQSSTTFASQSNASQSSTTFASQSKFSALIAAIFAMTSSVFGYWSFRVMADPLFSFLVLLYFYYFPYEFKKAKIKNLEYWMSALLLAITMTRLEGLFVASATGLFFLIYSFKTNKLSVKNWLKNLKDNLNSILIFFVPQVLIYLPWTLYAKVLYKGPVTNNYLDEVQTFVFDLTHFKYFLTYTIYVLVIPLTFYFIWKAAKRLIDNKKEHLYLIPLALFLLQEFLIGFIWTPSLPRIYMAVIPFLSILFIYGLEIFQKDKINIRKYIIINLLFTILFVYLQYSQKLYFLGASKILFAIIVLGNLALMLIKVLGHKYEKAFVIMLLSLNVLITTVIIYNQSKVYESVMKGIEFVAPLDGIKAYSDETGNTEWYFKNDGYYLSGKNNIDDLSDQYAELKSNNVSYLLWTDEFNRGSSFIDPKSDTRFQLIFIHQQAIRDPLDIVADRLNILDDKDYTVFTTKVYKVL